MHKYNNQDHSMLTAMTAVDNIIDGVRSRDTCGPSIPSRNTTKRNAKTKCPKRSFPKRKSGPPSLKDYR